MNDPVGFTKTKEAIDQAQEILIVTHEQPTFDSAGSSLALLLGLTSLGKRVSIACPDPITVGLSNFVGANKISTAIGKKNFIVSLDYVEGSIEKVSYNIEGNKFNLIVEPRAGFPPFSQEKVHFLEASGDPSVIFVVDTIHLGGLKNIYEEHRELFADKTVVNIDRHANNSNFGQINIVDSTASSTAELIAQLLSTIGVKLTQDIATNLLNALYGATANFLVPNVSANAFELAAVCVKAGATRFAPLPMPDAWPAPGGLPPMPRPLGAGFPRMPRPMASRPQVQYPYNASGNTPIQSPSFQSEPMSQISPTLDPKQASDIPDPHDHKPGEEQHVQDNGLQKAQPAATLPGAVSDLPQGGNVAGRQSGTGQAPADWLKPKIFKSSNVS